MNFYSLDLCEYCSPIAEYDQAFVKTATQLEKS